MSSFKPRKIKVCHVASIDLTIRFVLLNQLKMLKTEGYKVSAVCSPGPHIKEIEKEGIPIKTIKITRAISPVSDLISLIKLFSYFRKEKFDIVHTHTPKPGLLGQMAAKMAGIPIIINTLHGFYFHKNSPFLKRRFYILIERMAAIFSELILSQNREDIKTAIEEKICPPGKIKFLGNGIDLSKFNPERFSREFIEKKKKELKIGPSKKIIGMVGRLVKEKGYFELFEAFKILLKKFPQTLLLIIGPLEPEKKDAISPDVIKDYGIERNVIYLGQRTDLDEIYPLMDIFVLPSQREGFPRSILEASAMRKPVVATNIRGCREAVEDKITGILVPVKNPEKLARAIIYLFENPKDSQKMAEEGRKKAKKEFDENQIFNRIKREYQRLIKEKL